MAQAFLPVLVLDLEPGVSPWGQIADFVKYNRRVVDLALVSKPGHNRDELGERGRIHVLDHQSALFCHLRATVLSCGKHIVADGELEWHLDDRAGSVYS